MSDQDAVPGVTGGENSEWITYQAAHRRVAQGLGLDPRSTAVWLRDRAVAERIGVKADTSHSGEQEPYGPEPRPSGPTLWWAPDLEAELRAATRPQLTYREVVEHHLRYQTAHGGRPDPVQAWLWLRKVLPTGYPTLAGPVSHREHLRDVEALEDAWSDATLREALDAVTFDQAEVEALLLPPGRPAGSGASEPAGGRPGEVRAENGSVYKYDWELIAMGVGDRLTQRSPPVKNEEVVAMIQDAARRLNVTVPKPEAARKKARRWLQALGKGKRERE